MSKEIGARIRPRERRRKSLAKVLGGGSEGSGNPVQGVIGGLMGVVGSLEGKKGQRRQADLRAPAGVYLPVLRFDPHTFAQLLFLAVAHGYQAGKAGNIAIRTIPAEK